jgi:hypothetical protein
MLFSNVFVYAEPRSANRNLRRSFCPSAAAPCSLPLCHGDEKPISTTLLIPVTYKCPLPQPFSFDIITNALFVDATSTFLNSTHSFAQKHVSPAFFALRTLPVPYPVTPTSLMKTAGYTSNSDLKLLFRLFHQSRVTSHQSRPLDSRIMSAPNQGDASQ